MLVRILGLKSRSDLDHDLDDRLSGSLRSRWQYQSDTLNTPRDGAVRMTERAQEEQITMPRLVSCNWPTGAGLRNHLVIATGHPPFFRPMARG